MLRYGVATPPVFVPGEREGLASDPHRWYGDGPRPKSGATNRGLYSLVGSPAVSAALDPSTFSVAASRTICSTSDAVYPHSTNCANYAAAMPVGLRHVSLVTCDSMPPTTTASAICGARVGLLWTIAPSFSCAQ